MAYEWGRRKGRRRHDAAATGSASSRPCGRPARKRLSAWRLFGPNPGRREVLSLTRLVSGRWTPANWWMEGLNVGVLMSAVRKNAPGALSTHPEISWGGSSRIVCRLACRKCPAMHAAVGWVYFHRLVKEAYDQATMM